MQDNHDKEPRVDEVQSIREKKSRRGHGYLCCVC
jgi:hypothetical protein